MGDGEFVCELREREPGATGGDEAVFLVRPNAGLPFAPVAETASGGELSRIALAIAAVAGGETLVFDEIDAGIGGETANAVGRVLQRLAERAQVITITHLPQIAALADRHFRVEKVAGRPDAHADRAARRRGAEGRARADARRPGVPCHGTQLTASSSRRSRTSGRSSPSRTTSPTGGPGSRASSPTAAASRPARAGRCVGPNAAELLPAARRPTGTLARPRRRADASGSRSSSTGDRIDAELELRAGRRATAPRRRSSSTAPWLIGLRRSFPRRALDRLLRPRADGRERVTPADLRRCYL